MRRHLQGARARSILQAADLSGCPVACASAGDHPRLASRARHGQLAHWLANAMGLPSKHLLAKEQESRGIPKHDYEFIRIINNYNELLGITTNYYELQRITTN